VKWYRISSPSTSEARSQHHMLCDHRSPCTISRIHQLHNVKMIVEMCEQVDPSVVAKQKTRNKSPDFEQRCLLAHSGVKASKCEMLIHYALLSMGFCALSGLSNAFLGS
jgi:hypothetical protein